MEPKEKCDGYERQFRRSKDSTAWKAWQLPEKIKSYVGYDWVRVKFLHFFTRKTTYVEWKISDDTLHFNEASLNHMYQFLLFVVGKKHLFMILLHTETSCHQTELSSKRTEPID